MVIEDDGMTEAEFKAEMQSINADLAALNAEAQMLERKIAENLNSLVGDRSLSQKISLTLNMLSWMNFRTSLTNEQKWY